MSFRPVVRESTLSVPEIAAAARSLQAAGRPDEALAFLDRAIRIAPTDATLRLQRGAALRALGRLRECVECCREILAIEPDFLPAHSQLGATLYELGDLDAAKVCQERVVAGDPGNALAQARLGLILYGLHQFEEALARFDQTVALRPALAPAHIDRGNVLSDLGRLDEALASYQRAIEIDPNNGIAHHNRAIALRELGRQEQALDAFARALQCGAPRPAVLANRGVALVELLRHDEALSDFEQASALEPQFALAHWNEALVRLVTGDFVGGWRSFEWRWRYSDLGLSPRSGPPPLWLGESDPRDSCILLWHEQGLGDTIQFCRYATLLAQRGARVVLYVPQCLESLMRTLPGVAQVSAREPGDEVAIDLHVPLLSLPLAFGTTLSTIPAQAPYLAAEPACAHRWAEHLGSTSRRARVGLAWAGNPQHRNDRNRSIPLAALSPILRHRQIEWVSLQKDVRSADVTMLARMPLADFSSSFDSFAETAGLIANLDLVVCVDSAIAHLAGAMGKPVWILLPYAPDWRWLLERSDSPWYPTARLFRQSARSDWDEVVLAVDRALQSWLCTRTAEPASGAPSPA